MSCCSTTHPYERLVNALAGLAERYAAEGRWFDALRMIHVGLELTTQNDCADLTHEKRMSWRQ